MNLLLFLACTSVFGKWFPIAIASNHFARDKKSFEKSLRTVDLLSSATATRRAAAD